MAGRSPAFQAQYGRAVLSAAGREPVFYAPLTFCFKGGKEIMMERMRAVAGKNGQRRLALDFSGHTVDYLADVEAPVIWADGRYRLGAVRRLADADEFQFF